MARHLPQFLPRKGKMLGGDGINPDEEQSPLTAGAIKGQVISSPRIYEVFRPPGLWSWEEHTALNEQSVRASGDSKRRESVYQCRDSLLVASV